METQILKKNGKTYKNAIDRFIKQYYDIAELNKLFINADNKVYAGEWTDSKKIIHFNSGYLLDLHKTIIFK